MDIGVVALVILLTAASFLYRRRKAAATDSIGYETKRLAEDYRREIYPASPGGDDASGVHGALGRDAALQKFSSSGYAGNSLMEDQSDNLCVLIRCTEYRFILFFTYPFIIPVQPTSTPPSQRTQIASLDLPSPSECCTAAGRAPITKLNLSTSLA